jgi:hypothetical protein
VEADLLLQRDGIADGLILDARQSRGGDLVALMRLPRPMQLGRAQEAADLIGAEGWDRAFGQDALPISAGSHRARCCAQL